MKEITIGIIGSGMIGANVARLSVAAGLKVIICNSRGPKTLSGLVSELGAKAQAAAVEEVAAIADLIILAIPFAAYKKLPADLLARKTIIDTLNYYPQRDGSIPEVKTDTISTSELVQRHFYLSQVVRAINNMDFVRLLTSARPSEASDRSALPIAGDNVSAKETVAAFLDRIGYDTVDIGALAESWRSEPTTPIYVSPYMHRETSYMENHVSVDTFMTAPGRVVTRKEVETLVKSAVRHDKMFGLLPVFKE